jgi:hypothetical protein
MVRTRVNNPERVFLNSSDDGRNTTQLGFSEFTCTYDTPILGAKKTMLLRATIPNAQVNIPQYQLVFWYYSLSTATAIPGPASLRAVRLYPESYQPPTGFTAFTKNRFFSDPADFVSQLNLAAAAGGDNVTYNTLWVAGDVTFSYNATTKQITFTGNTAGRFYCPAGWNDINVNLASTYNNNNGTAWAANTVYPNGAVVTNGGVRYVAINGSAGTAGFNTDGAFTQIANQITIPSTANIATLYFQPLVPNWTLNLRVGYAMSGTSFGPQITQPTGGGLPQVADLTHIAYANGTAVPVDSYPNLVYSQCVYLYSNIVAGVSLGSGGQHNVLSVVPVNAPQLGVIQYTALTVNMMSKLVDTIYEITVQMRDDANQPFVLPDNAQVNLELAMVYE